MATALCIVSNIVFCATGVLFLPFYQQASYWGFNEPTSLLAPYAFFLCMTCGGLCQSLVGRRWTRFTTRQMRLCGAIAAFTVLDNTLAVAGIEYIGSMLYSIIYGWVVVAIAIIRRFLLGRSLETWQWVGVILVSAGLSLAGISGDQDVKGGPWFILGFCSVLIASTFDALMYVGVEELLGMKIDAASVEPEVSASQLTLVVGLVGTTLLAPVGWIYAVTGYWQAVLYQPLSDHIDHECTQVLSVQAGQQPKSITIVLVWIGGGVILYMHYVSLYILVKSVQNSVVAGVSKGIQSVVVLFLNASLFGACDERQQLTLLKTASSLTVILGTLLYSLCKASNQNSPVASNTSNSFGCSLREH